MQKMKSRCKLLIQNLAPEVLKMDIERLVSLTRRDAKFNDVTLYQLILERAVMQQHYHVMSMELRQQKPPATKKKKPFELKKPANHTGAPRERERKEKKGPKDGSWICKGTHWSSECPNATEEERERIKQQMARKGYRPGGHVKKVTLGDSSAKEYQVTVNGLYDLSFVLIRDRISTLLPASTQK